MSLKRFKSLLMKSAQIQRAIEYEQKRRLPDWLRVLRLKKVRLLIKDQLARLASKAWKMPLQPASARIRYYR